MKQIGASLRERSITQAECMVRDLTDIARGKIARAAISTTEKGMRLRESILLQSVTGDYVEDDIYYDLLDPADIDMICKPDDDGIYLVPWAIEPTAQIIHDCYDKQGQPIEMSPRNILKKIL